ncbi:flagellar biosynthetic protein FliO [Desulfoluna spongiiphila]|uniref:Flagellar protein n=1 Tax=Desulfoluna spongiiphila TaxID=419481 RepID=A0A1G5AK19_9BACT|nr:flagellar biosynthetic protein FliO [Desulfoluna spongiiphila]SCX78195.1 flagellar protein FliO/FliZ [Desulfoluna spongiiphila]
MDAGAVQNISVIPDMGALVLKSGAMLLVVLAVLMGCVFLLKRFSGMRQLAGQGAVTVRGTYHLGPKERIMLVDVEGVRLLLGVTPAGISTLHTFGDTEETPEDEGGSPSFFETLFRRRLEKGGDRAGETTHET